MQPNHTCGGANIWADISSSSEIFCSAGSYCSTITKRIPCSSGYCFIPTCGYSINFKSWILVEVIQSIEDIG